VSAGPRVLVVDDDPLQRELVERALSRDGFELACVATVAELAAVAPGFGPEIVLMDVNLPGTSLERAIAVARDVAAAARVVLYSAWDEAKLKVLAQRSGADAFISKSESVVAIGRRLRELRRE
jgi:DNA-binding response OmpR family regulator